MRAAVCVACLALTPASAFRSHAGGTPLGAGLSPDALSEPPAREVKLSVAQLSERRAAPGVTIKYFSTLHHDTGVSGGSVLRGAVRQMRRTFGADDGNTWEHGQWLGGFWKASDGNIPWSAWKAYNQSHDRNRRGGFYCKYDCAARCGFTWDDAAAKVGPPCQEDLDCKPRPPGAALAGWSLDAKYGCYDDLPDYKRGMLGECVSRDTREQSDAYCAVVCGASPGECDMSSCMCTKSQAWELKTKIERHDDSTPPERMPDKSHELLEQARLAYLHTVSGLPTCLWKPKDGCSNVTQYECFDGPSAGKCSGHNWMYNTSCLYSCVHVSTLSPAPYYALWVDGPQERKAQRGERQPRYVHSESRMTPERRGIKLRVSDLLMNRMCKSLKNKFVGVSLYSPQFENKARRLVRSCERVGICCKATHLPHDAFGPHAPEGSEEFRFQAIAMKPSFLLSEMEVNELPVVFLDCDLEFHRFPDLFTPGAWPQYGRDVALFNFWGNETRPETRNRPHIGSAVAFFNTTKPARDLLNAWAEAMAWPANERAPDDQVLDLLLTEGEWLKRASYGWLPTSYLRTMPFFYRGIDPVINHDHGSAPGLVNHSDAKPQYPRVKAMQLRYPFDFKNKGLPLQLSEERAEEEWETLKQDTPYWKVAPPTDCWQPVEKQQNCPLAAVSSASGPVSVVPPDDSNRRCVREWQSDISSWFVPPRDPTERDCSYACLHERSAWCVGYDFLPTGGGTCKLYDDCTGNAAQNLLKVETAPRCNCEGAGSSSCAVSSDDGSRCWSHCCSRFKATVLKRLNDVWK